MGTARVSIRVIAALLAVSPAAQGQRNMKKDHRLGFVGVKYDDGSAGHYTNAFPIMEKYGVKGVYCVNAGNFSEKPGGSKITAEQCVEMYKAGHEIVDHTLHHKSPIWGKEGTVEEWTKRTEESLRILNGLGIKVRGWNLPGGQGSCYTKALRDIMPKYFDYARGTTTDLPYKPFELCWNFYGDPYGYSGVSGSWESYVDGYDGKATREEAAAAVERLKTSRADAIQRGVFCAFCFHQIVEPNQAKWALEEYCKWIKENEVPNATVGEAFDAFRNPRTFYPVDIEQVPCYRFQYDLDDNGRPDGWQECAFAPDDVKGPGEGRVAEFQTKASTSLCGPEPGKTKVSFMVRSADGAPCKIRLRIRGGEVLDGFARSKPKTLAEVEVEAGKDWRELAATFDVPPKSESCSMEFRLDDDKRIYVACPSWRRVVEK